MNIVAEVARQILEEALEEAKTEPEVKTTEFESTQENTKHETIEVQVDIENVDEQSLARNLSLVSTTKIINQYLYPSFENFICKPNYSRVPNRRRV